MYDIIAGLLSDSLVWVDAVLHILTMITIAIALALDAFAVATVVSVILGNATPRQILRLSFHFGLFQAFMPILGYALGTQVQPYIAAWDHWVAFGLLFFIGLRTIISALDPQDTHKSQDDPTRGLSLVGLSTATSIDALAVGLSFAALKADVFTPAILTGIFTAILSVLGMLLGKRLGILFGRWMECLGGVVLIVIGFSILIRHLL